MKNCGIRKERKSFYYVLQDTFALSAFCSFHRLLGSNLLNPSKTCVLCLYCGRFHTSFWQFRSSSPTNQIKTTTQILVCPFIDLFLWGKRTRGDIEGHCGRWLWYVIITNIIVVCTVSIVTKVIFSCRKSVFRDVRTDYNLDLSFLVNFNDNGGFVVGTHKHFPWGYKRSLLTGYAKN